MYQFKSYGQNKIEFKTKTISFVVLPQFGMKKTTFGGNWGSLYFWNQWSKGNGKTHRAKLLILL